MIFYRLILILSLLIPSFVTYDSGKASANNIAIQSYGKGGYFQLDDGKEDIPKDVVGEVVGKRTENSKTSYLGNGKYSLESNIGVIYYKDNYTSTTEQWKDIDLTPVAGKTKTEMVVKTAPYELVIDGLNVTVKDKKTGSITTLKLTDIGTSLTGSTAVATPTLVFSNGKATASNISTDTDLEISWSNSQISYTRILKSANASTLAKFNVTQTGTGISLTTKAEDSKTADDKSVVVTSSIYDGVLTESIDTSKISLTYPVRIDPTLVISNSGKDAFLHSGDTTTNYGTQAYLFAGRWDGLNIYTAITEFTISWGVDVPSGATISSATLSLYETGNNIDKTFYVSRLLRSDWSETSCTQNNYKLSTAWTTAGAGSNGNDYTSTDQASKASITVHSYNNWTVTNQVIWAQTNNKNIIFKINSTDATNTKRATFSSREGVAGKYPITTIIYTTSATVTTTTASSVSNTTVIMGGNVTSVGAGNVTRYGVQYGASGTYGSWQNVTGTMTSPFSFSNTTSGLSSGTAYYFRAFCNNTSDGMAYGSELSFITLPSLATNVAATDGTDTTKVVITWTKPTGATGYKVYEGTNLLATLGDVATYDDSAAPAPTVTAGVPTASDGTSSSHVTLSIAGDVAVNGASRTYKVVAFNSSGDAPDSATDTGYRGTTTLTYAWQKSAADSDAAYGAVAGGTTDPYNDTAAVIDEYRYYKCVVSMTGAVSNTTVADRGWRIAVIPSIDTATASAVTTTSARLNANVISDGGSPSGVAVRFGYSNVTHPVTFADYATDGIITAWSASNYTTAELPWVDIVGLTSNTTYYFNVNAQNSGGNAYGTQISFTTVYSNITTCPTFFSGIPSITTIDLQWAKTGNLAYVKLYYQQSAIPSSNTTGTLIYSGADNYFQHTGLIGGTSYGYRLYGYEGGVWSTDNTTLMVTTLPAGTTPTALPTPATPSSMYITPSNSWLSYIPLHELADANATSLGMPVGNFYLICIVISAIIIAFVVYRKTKDELIALIAIIMIFGIGTTQGVVPLWITIGTALIVIPIWAIRRRA